MSVKFLLERGSWQHKYWNQNECTAIKDVNGKIAIVDHSIQTTVALADTFTEAEAWIDGKDPDPDDIADEIAGRITIGE